MKNLMQRYGGKLPLLHKHLKNNCFFSANVIANACISILSDIVYKLFINAEQKIINKFEFLKDTFLYILNLNDNKKISIFLTYLMNNTMSNFYSFPKKSFLHLQL